MKRIIFVFTLILLFFVFSPKTFASDFPAVPSGPGYLLPDSQFYGIDRLYQKVKLVLAFTPEKRALVRNQIIGERMAELRVMYERSNRRGINIALIELTEGARKAEADLKEAASLSRYAVFSAKTLNDNLREYRKIISQVIEDAPYETSLNLEAANQSLLASKITVEDFLNPEDQEEAINNDLEDELDSQVLGVSTRVNKIDKKLDQIQKKANRTAEIERKKITSEETRLKTLQEKNKEKRLKLLEKRKQLLEQRKQKLEQAREAAKRAREAAKRAQELRQAQQELRTNTEELEQNPVKID